MEPVTDNVDWSPGTGNQSPPQDVTPSHPDIQRAAFLYPWPLPMLLLRPNADHDSLDSGMGHLVRIVELVLKGRGTVG